MILEEGLGGGVGMGMVTAIEEAAFPVCLELMVLNSSRCLSLGTGGATGAGAAGVSGCGGKFLGTRENRQEDFNRNRKILNWKIYIWI